MKWQDARSLVVQDLSQIDRRSSSCAGRRKCDALPGAFRIGLAISENQDTYSNFPSASKCFRNTTLLILFI